MISDVALDILINQVAQGVQEFERIGVAFGAMSEAERRGVIRRISVLALQAGAHDADVAPSIVMSGVRLTRTAAVLLAKGRVDLQLAKIANLPGAELMDGLRLTVALLAIADQRRRST